MEFLFEILGELLLQFAALLLRFCLQLLADCIVQIGVAGLVDTFERERHPALSTIGFVVWGAFAGAISLWPFPHAFITNYWLRLLNLVLTPLISALVMRFMAKMHEQRDLRFMGQGKFIYALATTATMALVRFLFAT